MIGSYIKYSFPGLVEDGATIVEGLAVSIDDNPISVAVTIDDDPIDITVEVE